MKPQILNRTSNMKPILLGFITALSLTCATYAGPSVTGTWSATMQALAHDFATGGDQFFGNSAMLVIEREQKSSNPQVATVFSGYLIYSGNPTRFPLSGVARGLQVRATADGGVIEGTLSGLRRGLYRRMTFTSIVPQGNGLYNSQVVVAGIAVRP